MLFQPGDFLCVDDVQSKKTLLDTLEKNPSTKALWGDHAYLWNFDIGVDLYSMPFFFAWQAHHLSQGDYKKPDTSAVFNFMINKKMVHRYLTMRLIEYFRLGPYDYTYSGSCVNINDAQILDDLNLCDPERKIFNKQTMCEILGEVTIPPRFLGVKNNVDEVVGAGHQANFVDCRWSWENGLDKVFESSLISLITESANGDYDQITNFTEKTVYAVLGLTIPIWPGGYRHAETFELMGFDIFSDLIDHSYQNERTVFMRCWRAFKDNLDILQDLKKARKIREAIMSRLLYNREHLVSKQLINWYHDEIKNWPPEIKKQLFDQKRYALITNGLIF